MIQSRLLPDGVRLHLHHGPIDLILWADEAVRGAAYAAAAMAFDGLLEDLVAELPALRSETPGPLHHPVAQAMEGAVAPFRPAFVTPMAAVAGAVADHVAGAMARTGARKAWVNNGGDIALVLGPGQNFSAAMPGGRVTLQGAEPWRGIATSGRGGRSHSLGIADAVTVVARTAAEADAAATMIANAVNLPGHPSVSRAPACDLSPDSDLGARLVVTGLGPLARDEIDRALAAGRARAQRYLARGLIGGAHLALRGQSTAVGAMAPGGALALEETEDA
ncbi:UPF0280 family protein [Maritimibacter alkaliphilus]|uniref:UPF0280 family protein n=1 Tax=Maritimibacter alkaliphilus TaxID=404236 RepID=UPI001C97D366|nr:UPF0280 family protein [Maritimibacter alkaliphilus]MBY6091736.1 UPF0280 family protein [Maritimibacter alkaliphilus]